MSLVFWRPTCKCCTEGPITRRACFVFESFTIAQIIADKLDRQGFEAKILNQDWEAIARIPDDPHRRLMGAWFA